MPTIVVRPRDDLHADDFADACSAALTLPASVAALTAATSPVTKAATRALPTLSQPQELHVGGFHHCVGGLDQGHMKPLVSIMPSASRVLAITRFSQFGVSKLSSLLGVIIVGEVPPQNEFDPSTRTPSVGKRSVQGLNSSTLVAFSRSVALPSSVSRWTSSLIPSPTRTSTSSKTVRHAEFTRRLIRSPSLTP
jgi:hypothetical protein